MIQIINGETHGKRGYILKVDGLYISSGFNAEYEIKAIQNEIGIPYGATEWVSVEAVRRFWNKYRPFIISSLDKPCRSVWGQLIPVLTKEELNKAMEEHENRIDRTETY